MIVPTLHNGTDLKSCLQNAKLPHSSDVKTIGIQTVQMATDFLPTHFPKSPIRIINLLSWAAMVLPASQQGQTVKATGTAKTGVNNSQGIDFYAVSLAIGHQNVHPVAGYSLCLHRFLTSQKTEHWVVCH